MTQLRFRCPECSRALAAPLSAIGKRIGCPMCRSVYEVSCVIDAESEPAAEPSTESVVDEASDTSRGLSRWIPASVRAAGGAAGNLAGNVANVVKNQASAGLQAAHATASTGLQAAQSTAVNAANSVGAAVSSSAKRAVAAVAPFTQHVAGVASAIVPGSGELMTGKPTQGACTFGAFLGSLTAVAACVPLIPAAPAFGVVIAVPLGIQVFSAWQGSKSGKEAGASMRAAMEESLTADEAARLAANMKAAAESMSAEEFERIVRETEERELQIVETGQQRIILKRVM